MKPPFDPRKITIEALSQFRFATDPLADGVISQIKASVQERQINQILMTLVKSDTFRKGIFSALGQPLSDTLDSAEVFYSTGRLLSRNGNTDPLARRLMETAQMIVNIFSTRGLSANGLRIVTV